MIPYNISMILRCKGDKQMIMKIKIKIKMKIKMKLSKTADKERITHGNKTSK